MVDAVDSWFALVLPIIGAGLPDELYQAFSGVVPMPGDFASTSLSRLAGRFRDRVRADQRRQAQRARWAERFESVDAWLAPCLAVPAFEHDHRPVPQRDLLIDGRSVPALDLTAWPGAIGAMLLPAVAIPAGQTSAGLPVGVQVIGPYLQDRRLLRIAALIDEAGPRFAAPPIG
jgi:amidase